MAVDTGLRLQCSLQRKSHTVTACTPFCVYKKCVRLPDVYMSFLSPSVSYSLSTLAMTIVTKIIACCSD